MDGLEAMHDGTAAARGWSPQQLHRLNSYLLGGDAEDGGGYHQALGDESGARCWTSARDPCAEALFTSA